MPFFSRWLKPYIPLGLCATTLCAVGWMAVAQTPPVSHREVVLPESYLIDKKIVLESVATTLMDTHLTSVGRIAYDDLCVSHIFSPVTGRVQKVFAGLGDRVREGQRLAWIASPDMGVAQSDVDKAKADFEAATRDQTRQEFLFSRHATSEREVETARDVFRRASAELARARHKLKLLGGTGVQKEQGIDQVYQLVSTLAGEVTQRSINVGDEVQGQYSGGATRELYTVADLSRVWVIADLYESDVSRVALGARVEVFVDAVPQERFVGKVDWISDVLDPNVRTAKIRCAIPNPKGLLKPDMFATLKLEAQGHATTTLPSASVSHIGPKSFVYVAQRQPQDHTIRFVRRPVVVDEVKDEERLPVLHGVKLGDEVVVAGQPLIIEEMGP